MRVSGNDRDRHPETGGDGTRGMETGREGSRWSGRQCVGDNGLRIQPSGWMEMWTLEDIG